MRKFSSPKSKSQVGIKSEQRGVTNFLPPLSLSVSLKKSVVFLIIIDGQIIKVKLKFLESVSVRLISTREILCIQKEVGNLLASREKKEQTKIRLLSAEKTGKELSCAGYVTLATL